MNWTTDDAGLSTVAIAVDGVVVNTITSPCLVEEIGMDFDRETMPGWMVRVLCATRQTLLAPIVCLLFFGGLLNPC